IPGLVVAYAKKRPLFPAERFCEAANSLIHCDKVRIAGADHPLRIDKAIHINRDPAAVQKYEVLVPNQPDMVRTISLDKELFRVSSKAEHFAMTRLELLLVHRRRLSCASHVGLARASARARAGAHPGFMSVSDLISGLFCSIVECIFFVFVGAVVCVSFVWSCDCCGSVVWPKARNGSAIIAISVRIFIQFLPSYLIRICRNFGPVSNSIWRHD